MIEVKINEVYGCPEGICIVFAKDVPTDGRHSVQLYDGRIIHNYPGYALRERTPEEMPDRWQKGTP